jgi:hypothetical protein
VVIAALSDMKLTNGIGRLGESGGEFSGNRCKRLVEFTSWNRRINDEHAVECFGEATHSSVSAGTYLGDD